MKLPILQNISFYQLFIAAIGLCTLLVINGLTTSSLSVFDTILMQDFGINRTLLKTRETITYSVAAVCILFGGILIDRLGTRTMLLIGLGFMGLSLWGYSQATQLWHLYVIHLGLGLAYVSAGSVTVIILVASWWQSNRGLALGISLAGTSLGSTVFPPFLSYMSCEFTWRDVFLWLSFLPILLGIIVYFGVKNHRISRGLPQNNSGRSFKEAIQMPIFWWISACGFLAFLGVVGIVSNLMLHLQDVGFTLQNASWLLSSYFLAALLGKVSYAGLSDYFPPQKLLTVSLFGLAIGAVFLASGNDHWAALLPTLAVLGFSWGGVFSLYNVLIVSTFGLKSAGKINGTIGFFENLGALIGPLLVGSASVWAGSYNWPFGVIAGLFLATMLLTTRLKINQ